jgi:hypothetical protein
LFLLDLFCRLLKMKIREYSPWRFVVLV